MLMSWKNYWYHSLFCYILLQSKGSVDTAKIFATNLEHELNCEHVLIKTSLNSFGGGLEGVCTLACLEGGWRGCVPSPVWRGLEEVCTFACLEGGWSGFVPSPVWRGCVPSPVWRGCAPSPVWRGCVPSPVWRGLEGVCTLACTTLDPCLLNPNDLILNFIKIHDNKHLLLYILQNKSSRI